MISWGHNINKYQRFYIRENITSFFVLKYIDIHWVSLILKYSLTILKNPVRFFYGN
jgi:hypothetical protein